MKGSRQKYFFEITTILKGSNSLSDMSGKGEGLILQKWSVNLQLLLL